MKLHTSFRWVLIMASLPLVLLGLAVLVVRLSDLVRYDPAYFTKTYIERYNTPGSVARALEIALQTDDQALLAELHGLRWPVRFETGPSIHFVMLWERTDRYSTYLYFDEQTYERHSHYVEQVKGRWVVSPPDLHYYLYSGRWKDVFVPVAIGWWLLGGLAIALVWLFRSSERLRMRFYGN